MEFTNFGMLFQDYTHIDDADMSSKKLKSKQKYRSQIFTESNERDLFASDPIFDNSNELLNDFDEAIESIINNNNDSLQTSSVIPTISAQSNNESTVNSALGLFMPNMMIDNSIGSFLDSLQAESVEYDGISNTGVSETVTTVDESNSHTQIDETNSVNKEPGIPASSNVSKDDIKKAENKTDTEVSEISKNCDQLLEIANSFFGVAIGKEFQIDDTNFVFKSEDIALLNSSNQQDDELINQIVAGNEISKIADAKKTKIVRRVFPKHTVDQTFVDRINSYSTFILSHPSYQSYINAQIQKFGNKFLQPKEYFNNCLPTILPNYINIKAFSNHQDGWEYSRNPDRDSLGNIQMRWTNQPGNFYSPFVFRQHPGDASTKQGLCPYCPVNENTNWDLHFHSIADSTYMHHLCNQHGVYSNGYELPAPLFVKEQGDVFAFCTDCYRLFKASKTGKGYENNLIAYYRHMYTCHNQKKQKRTAEQKAYDKNRFKLAGKLETEFTPGDQNKQTDLERVGNILRSNRKHFNKPEMLKVYKP